MTANSSGDNLENLLITRELRRVDQSKLCKLSAILDETNSWRNLLEALTSPNEADYSCKLNLTLNAINLIEQQTQTGKSPCLALLNHWAITGRRRPTIFTLLSYLHKCNLKWAEHYVCESILGVESIDELLSKLTHLQQKPSLEGPSKPLAITLKPNEYSIDDQYKFQGLLDLVEGIHECDRYSFKAIYESANKFCGKEQSIKIGEGRFSSVFKAKTYKLEEPDDEMIVAAKLLKSDCDIKYLKNEINLTEKIKHENIIELLGISLGGCASSEENSELNYICLVYPFFQNGSLLDCLSGGLPTRNMEFIKAPDRFNILYKIALGIDHLHSLSIIHRDIKTANVLIDDNAQPKIGDFTLVRQLDHQASGETQNIIGTSVYMPREAFCGDISTKFDTFSYGIVMLEVLTGMRPFNEDQNEDLLTYMHEKLSDLEDQHSVGSKSFEEAKDKLLLSILDSKAGDWDFKKCKALFNISLKATESRKKDRPEMKSVVPLIENVLQEHLINWTDDL